MMRSDGWEHVPVPPGVTTDPTPRQRGIAHRNQLVVDEHDWPSVDRALSELGVGYTGLHVDFGLARITLSGRTYDEVMFEKGLLTRVEELLDGRAARWGRNRLAAPAQLAFDGPGPEATPKVVSSDIGPAKPVYDVDVAPRTGPDLAAQVRVGVVDTPFVDHDYLAGSCLFGPTSLEAVRRVESPGHATFVAGLIVQVAPGAVVLAERAIKASNVADLVSVHDAICRLTLAGAHIINLSLGCASADNQIPFVLAHALDWSTRTARSHDRPVPVFVAAAGNSSDDTPFWPAADPRVCAVAAAENASGAWRLTQWTGRGSWVDVAARGESLISTCPDVDVSPPSADTWAAWSGSSFAAAVVSGLKAAALAEHGTADLEPATPAMTLPPGNSRTTGLPIYDPKQIQHQ